MSSVGASSQHRREAEAVIVKAGGTEGASPPPPSAPSTSVHLTHPQLSALAAAWQPLGLATEDEEESANQRKEAKGFTAEPIYEKGANSLRGAFSSEQRNSTPHSAAATPTKGSELLPSCGAPREVSDGPSNSDDLSSDEAVASLLGSSGGRSDPRSASSLRITAASPSSDGAPTPLLFASAPAPPLPSSSASGAAVGPASPAIGVAGGSSTLAINTPHELQLFPTTPRRYSSFLPHPALRQSTATVGGGAGAIHMHMGAHAPTATVAATATSSRSGGVIGYVPPSKLEGMGAATGKGRAADEDVNVATKGRDVYADPHATSCPPYSSGTPRSARRSNRGGPNATPNVNTNAADAVNEGSSATSFAPSIAPHPSLPAHTAIPPLPRLHKDPQQPSLGSAFSANTRLPSGPLHPLLRLAGSGGIVNGHSHLYAGALPPLTVVGVNGQQRKRNGLANSSEEVGVQDADAARNSYLQHPSLPLAALAASMDPPNNSIAARDPPLRAPLLATSGGGTLRPSSLAAPPLASLLGAEVCGGWRNDVPPFSSSSALVSVSSSSSAAARCPSTATGNGLRGRGKDKDKGRGSREGSESTSPAQLLAVVHGISLSNRTQLSPTGSLGSVPSSLLLRPPRLPPPLSSPLVSSPHARGLRSPPPPLPVVVAAAPLLPPSLQGDGLLDDASPFAKGPAYLPSSADMHLHVREKERERKGMDLQSRVGELPQRSGNQNRQQSRGKGAPLPPPLLSTLKGRSPRPHFAPQFTNGESSGHPPALPPPLTAASASTDTLLARQRGSLMTSLHAHADDTEERSGVDTPTSTLQQSSSSAPPPLEHHRTSSTRADKHGGGNGGVGCCYGDRARFGGVSFVRADSIAEQLRLAVVAAASRSEPSSSPSPTPLSIRVADGRRSNRSRQRTPSTSAAPSNPPSIVSRTPRSRSRSNGNGEAAAWGTPRRPHQRQRHDEPYPSIVGSNSPHASDRRQRNPSSVSVSTIAEWHPSLSVAVDASARQFQQQPLYPSHLHPATRHLSGSSSVSGGGTGGSRFDTVGSQLSSTPTLQPPLRHPAASAPFASSSSLSAPFSPAIPSGSGGLLLSRNSFHMNHPSRWGRAASPTTRTASSVGAAVNGGEVLIEEEDAITSGINALIGNFNRLDDPEATSSSSSEVSFTSSGSTSSSSAPDENGAAPHSHRSHLRRTGSNRSGSGGSSRRYRSNSRTAAGAVSATATAAAAEGGRGPNDLPIAPADVCGLTSSSGEDS